MENSKMFCRYLKQVVVILVLFGFFAVSIFAVTPQQTSAQFIAEDFSYSISPHEVADLFSLDDTLGRGLWNRGGSPISEIPQ
jgi:hypothetical protein